MTTVICSRSKQEASLEDGFLAADPTTGEWFFVARGVPEEVPGEYSISISELLDTPAEFVDWMAHLHEKTWFQPEKFFEFFTRFREDNNLFGKI